jgi:hypothetical protein
MHYKKIVKVGSGSSHILWYSMQLREGPPAPLQLLDLVIQKLDSSSILLLGSLHMDLHPDYLNRVRQASRHHGSISYVFVIEKRR